LLADATAELTGLRLELAKQRRKKKSDRKNAKAARKAAAGGGSVFVLVVVSGNLLFLATLYCVWRRLAPV
jgi:hypothetical protein